MPSSPLSPQQIEDIARLFQQMFGKEPDAIYLVGSHAAGTATPQSDIDLVLETDLPLTKFTGPGFDFLKAINPGKVPAGITGIGPGPGQAFIGTAPNDIPKAGLLDPFFRTPGNVFPPVVKLR
jgi:hypothetical protein